MFDCKALLESFKLAVTPALVAYADKSVVTDSELPFPLKNVIVVPVIDADVKLPEAVPNKLPVTPNV